MCCIYTHIFGHICIPVDSLKPNLFAFRLHFTWIPVTCFLWCDYRLLWFFGVLWTTFRGFLQLKQRISRQHRRSTSRQSRGSTSQPSLVRPVPPPGTPRTTLLYGPYSSRATDGWVGWCTSHPDFWLTGRALATGQIWKFPVLQGNFGSRPNLFKLTILAS